MFSTFAGLCVSVINYDGLSGMGLTVRAFPRLSFVFDPLKFFKILHKAGLSEVTWHSVMMLSLKENLFSASIFFFGTSLASWISSKLRVHSCEFVQLCDHEE